MYCDLVWTAYKLYRYGIGGAFKFWKIQDHYINDYRAPLLSHGSFFNRSHAPVCPLRLYSRISRAGGFQDGRGLS